MRFKPTARTAAAVVIALALSGVWAGIAAADPLGYVTSEQAGTVRQVDLATGTVGPPIVVGSKPVALAITPDGSTAYVADYGSSEIVPIALATGTVGAPILLSDRPAGIAISPGGTMAYVVADDGFEWPITLSTGRLGNPSTIPSNSDALALTPAGNSGYMTNVADGTLTPFTMNSSTGQWSVGQPINLTFSTPDGIAMTPDGSTAYISSSSGGSITPITLATNSIGTSISLGSGTVPTSLAISPDGSTAYVTNFATGQADSTGQVTPVTLATSSLGTPIAVGADPSAIALVPASGITTAPPGMYGNTGGGGSGGGVTGPVTTLGNQQLTLTLSPGTGGGSAQSCHAAKTSLSVTLKRRVLSRGAKLKLRYVTFKLGKVSKRVTHLPATVRFPLSSYQPGSYTVSVRVSYTETVVRARARRKAKRATTVTITRTLKASFTVC